MRINARSAKKLIVKAKLTSFGNGNQDVKISAKDYLDVKLGLKIKINTSSSK